MHVRQVLVHFANEHSKLHKSPKTTSQCGQYELRHLLSRAESTTGRHASPRRPARRGVRHRNRQYVSRDCAPGSEYSDDGSASSPDPVYLGMPANDDKHLALGGSLSHAPRPY